MEQTIETIEADTAGGDTLVPELGVYRSVDNREYRSWRAMCNSDLSTIKEFSPMHLKYKRDHPPEPTPALAFGSALHTAVLEPEKFDSEYVVAGQCEATVKSTGQRCRSAGSILSCGGWFCGVRGHAPGPDESAGVRVIIQEDKEAIENIVRAIHFQPSAHALLSSPGDNELSVVFNHPENGQLSKMRTDIWRPEWDTLADVKTTENASRDEFMRSLTGYGYHRQAAFYLDGMNLSGVGAKHFAFIVVEKQAPYGVAVYRMMNDAIEAGREQLKRLVRVYKNCADREADLRRQGKSGASAWFGYESEFQDISISSWEMRKIIQGEQ